MWKMRRNIKLVTTEGGRNYLVSESTCHASKLLSENLLEIERKKQQIFMNKPVYLSLSMLEISKIVMFEFWYDFVNPKNREKAKLC